VILERLRRTVAVAVANRLHDAGMFGQGLFAPPHRRQ